LKILKNWKNYYFRKPNERGKNAKVFLRDWVRSICQIGGVGVFVGIVNGGNVDE
jgi:hypothetical protein